MLQGEKRRRQLVDVVKKVALRRTKAIIADQLPRKTDNVVFCQLQPLQYRYWGKGGTAAA
jgi:SNF2 family DNA or RNA helicase